MDTANTATGTRVPATSTEIAVLGGGPAGLAAALAAARKGRRVVLLERSAIPGGMAASFEVGGVRVDHGSHRLHPSIDPGILGELRALLGDDLQMRERSGRIRLAGRWIAFPFRATDMVRRLPRGFALAAARDAVITPLLRPRADTFAEVVRAGLGPTVARSFYAPYVEKLWGAPSHELAGELARRRVSASSPGDIARRILPGRRPQGRRFLYPKGGFGRISEALADAAVSAGAEIRYGARVTGITLHDRGAEVIGDDGTRMDTRHVWSTIPVPVLARLVEPGPPPEAIAATERLIHRALVLVYLVLDRDRYTPFDAHYFPESDVPVARVSEPKNYRADPADPTGRTVVCAEVPCWEGDATWRAPPAWLGSLVTDALVRSDLPVPDPVAVETRRLARVYPVYRPGFERDLDLLERWLHGTPGLITFGRQGLFVPDNTHHALAMGWAAAGALGPDGDVDRDAWHRARDGFRTHVVED